VHKRPSSISCLTPLYSLALLSAFSAFFCAPDPRFFSKRAVNRQESAPAIQQQTTNSAVNSDTLASVNQKAPDSVHKPVSQKLVVEPKVSEKGILQSSWSSAFEENPPDSKMPDIEENCTAVWYGPGLNGKKTASGERFDINKLTAAHPTLPFNSMVKVTNISNGLSVTVRINDRGPSNKKYCIDLSMAAAKLIDIEKIGAASVKIETVK
jgi:rare lipoprotein A (peptidoglycan hydrolase)